MKFLTLTISLLLVSAQSHASGCFDRFEEAAKTLEEQTTNDPVVHFGFSPNIFLKHDGRNPLQVIMNAIFVDRSYFNVSAAIPSGIPSSEINFEEIVQVIQSKIKSEPAIILGGVYVMKREIATYATDCDGFEENDQLVTKNLSFSIFWKSYELKFRGTVKDEYRASSIGADGTLPYYPSYTQRHPEI